MDLPHLSFDSWVGIGSAAITTIALIVSIVFYRLSIQKPVPMYAVDPLRVRIVDKTRMKVSGLAVFHNNVSLEGASVTATTVYFWNSGRAPIRKPDVLKPYILELDEHSEILDCDLAKPTREVCGFRLDFAISAEPSHQVTLGFDVLEPGDGVAIQIVHTGNPDGDVRLSGVSVGAREPRKTHIRDLGYTAKPDLFFTIALTTTALSAMWAGAGISKGNSNRSVAFFGLGLICNVLIVGFVLPWFRRRVIRNKGFAKLLD